MFFKIDKLVFGANNIIQNFKRKFYKLSKTFTVFKYTSIFDFGLISKKLNSV